MATEFIIGLQPPGSVTLTPNSNLLEFILITERVKEVTLVGKVLQDHHGQRQILSAVCFDGGNIDIRVRDSTSSSSETVHLLQKDGFRDNNATVPPNDYVKSLDLRESPFVDQIVLQQTCFSASDQPALYWKQITYIKIQSGAQTIEIGQRRRTSDSVKGKYLILPEERAHGPCMISGVGFHNQDILCLQIISISTNEFKIYPPPEISEHLYAYGKSSVGLVNLKVEGSKLKQVEETHFVGLEVSDPHVMEVVDNLSQYMTNWYSSRSAIHRIYPDLYALIDRSVTDNNRSIIFAAFRLDRHLRWRIQNEVKNGHSLDRDPFIRLKVHQVVHSLAKTLERCQRFIVNKPSMDCYAVAYLSGSFRDITIATLVLITQIGLTYMLFMSIIQDRESDFQILELNERSIITPILAIFSGMLVYKQLSNVFSMFEAYPKMRWSLMGIFEMVANCVMGILILAIQILIIAKTTDRVDYVLNSIAAIFILELDDNVIFLDDDGITDLNRRLLMKDFRDRINSIDESFFKVMNWRTARNSYQIIPQTCELKVLPPIQFTNSIRSMQSTSSSQQQSLEAVKIEFTEERQYNYALDGWAEIASSEPIIYSKIKPESKAMLRFNWRDQGYGNRKGQLRIRLVDIENGDDIASTPEYGIAPHSYEEVSEHFGFNHGLVRNSVKGCKFVLEVVVGGGGGHELFVKDFSFICESGLVASNSDFVEKVASSSSTDLIDFAIN